ncbi:biotin--[acetyl-CoA-carboxylase] ligase [Haloparvum sp. PAK95]|uniref:biotin--[acetyl-CoA-carboxylase] ligase n=1 Tax=Haloparvum sp. PAK95 TaxID=3418962 RepID=UPI003D2EC2B6
MSDVRRRLLEELAEGPVSGPEFAEAEGVSRAAVWKQIEGLRDAGFAIESTDEGYEVVDTPAFGGDAVAFDLDAPYDVEFHESIGSTNERARELAGEGAADVAVVADEQTGGRGRLDREWSAPSGGVYVSIVLRPDVPPAHAPIFTLAAAVATTRACREAGVHATIKWPNDVLVVGDGGGDGGEEGDGDGGEEGDGDSGDDGSADAESTPSRGGHKLAGILTEMEGEADRVNWLVVGIGVNANVDAAALPPGATSLREQVGDVDRRVFLQRVLEEFHDLAEAPETVLPAWRDYAETIGQQVRVETGSGVIEGEAVDVEFPGALVVETDEGRERVLAGDCEHVRPT